MDIPLNSEGDLQFDQVVAKLDNTGHGRVWVNGVELKSSLGMKVYCAANLMTVIELRLLCDYEFSGPAVVTNNPDVEEGTRQWVLEGPGITVYELTAEGRTLAEKILDDEFREIMTEEITDDDSDTKLA